MSSIPPLSPRTKEIILGSLLGDGSLRIHKPYKNARFSFRHSYVQKDYFLWKTNELKEISSEKNHWLQGKDGKDGWGGRKLRYQSKALVSLTELYRLTHRQGEKLIRYKWLNLLTPLSLTTWWLDDGSLVSDSRQGVLCTDGFPLKQIRVLARYMKKVWHVPTSIGQVKDTNRYRLWIRSTRDLQNFLRIILPHIEVPSMLGKVIMLYRDLNLQQRWISEMTQATSFSKEMVEKFLQEKRSRWRKFRE